MVTEERIRENIASVRRDLQRVMKGLQQPQHPRAAELEATIGSLLTFKQGLEWALGDGACLHENSAAGQHITELLADPAATAGGS